MQEAQGTIAKQIERNTDKINEMNLDRFTDRDGNSLRQILTEKFEQEQSARKQQRAETRVLENTEEHIEISSKSNDVSDMDRLSTFDPQLILEILTSNACSVSVSPKDASLGSEQIVYFRKIR